MPHPTTVRAAQVAVLLCLGAFAALVAYNNAIDYGSNFEYVRHVLSMDTTFPDSRLRSRAVTTPWLWHAAYGFLIAWEGLTAALLLGGALAMWRSRRSRAAQFMQAKRWAVWGCVCAIVLWLGGFGVLGGEWFAMWQSSQWNGQEAAFRFHTTALLVLIWLSQREADCNVHP